MIFKHLEITLATHNGQVEMRIDLESETHRYGKREIFPEDHLISIFDLLFDRAKVEIKRSLEEKA